MTPKWLKKDKPKGLDINEPVKIPDLKTPLPDPTRGKANKNWNWYNSTSRGRRWLKKERVI